MVESNTSRRAFILLAALVLLVAAGLRLYRLPQLPLGLHYDEAANGILAGEIARGATFPVFISSYTGKEVLFFYWAALWIKLLGMTPLALRLSAALVGLATVAATVWAVGELLHGCPRARWVALLTAAFLAVSFWHVVLSRYAFRAVTQPLLQALTVGALWRGVRLERRQRFWLCLGGLFCGLTAYTYLAARAFPVPLAVGLVVLFLADWDHRRDRAGQVGWFVGLAVLALAPMAGYWVTHPGSFLNRIEQVSPAGWTEAWHGIRACLGMFFWRGDPYVRFNVPHRPLFDPVTGGLFLVGLVMVICQFFRLPWPGVARCPPRLLAACAFLLTCLPVMLLPSGLAVGEITPSNLRTAGLLPFIYVFPALGLSALADATAHVRSAILRRWSAVFSLPSLTLAVLVLLTPLTGLTYFRDWASSAALYYEADGELVDVAGYLDDVELAGVTPYVAAIHYRHPTLAFLAEDYPAIRWLTGGRTVVYPAKGQALLVYPRSASGDLDWVTSALPEGALAGVFPGPDGGPAFHVYRLGAQRDLGPAVPSPANLADTVHVLGYDVVGQPVSGGQAQVAVWWRVLAVPAAGDYGPVARLADPWGFVWGSTQPFHYPAEQWTPGEVVVDHLSIPVEAGAPPGEYRIRLGLYSAQADEQLAVLDDTGRYAGLWVDLPVSLVRPLDPPALDDLTVRTRLEVPIGDLLLVGYNLDTPDLRPGESLYLTLFWRGEGAPLPDHQVALLLGDALLYAGAPVHGTYPTSEWRSGEVLADRYDPRLPLDVPPGEHPLYLQVDDLTLDLGTVTVSMTDRLFEPPPISHPLTAALGDQVKLLGYDLSAEAIEPGDTLSLTLYWQALTDMEGSYTVFTHLLAPDGSVAGQSDHPPVDGTYPTNLWLTGEVVVDVYEIALPDESTPGEYSLEVGMYVPETGVRLPVSGGSGDAIVLTSVPVLNP